MLTRLMITIALAFCLSFSFATSGFARMPSSPAAKPQAVGKSAKSAKSRTTRGAVKKPVKTRASKAERRFSGGAGIRLGHREVALTFDDGPVPGKTEKILAILDRHRVKATFLMTGRMAKAHPAIARKVARAGHSIGSHSYSHPNLAGLSYQAAVNEIRAGHEAVRRATGAHVGFFRFPYLAGTPRLQQWAAGNGLTVLGINIDSKDYFSSTPDAIASRTMAAVRRQGRGVILMHDIHARTVAMLPTLLGQLRAEGYRVVPLTRGGRSLLTASLD